MGVQPMSRLSYNLVREVIKSPLDDDIMFLYTYFFYFFCVCSNCYIPIYLYAKCIIVLPSRGLYRCLIDTVQML